MYLPGFRLLALGALAVSVDAFRDTSPFFFFSTAKHLKSSTPLQSASSLSSLLSTNLQQCSTDYYIIVSQPGVHAADYVDGKNSPSLAKSMGPGTTEDWIATSGYTVNEVIGTLDADGLRKTLEESCKASVLKMDMSTGSFPVYESTHPQIIEISMPAPPPSGPSRSAKLLENDSLLSSLLSTLPISYTVLYTTTPSPFLESSRDNDSPPYEMDSSFQSSLQMELKRDLSLHGISSNGSTSDDILVDGPLFERYGFFSPGLFMGLLVGLLLLSILYVGLSGLSSLQVSYAAFDKEMGPQAQKGKQQ